MTRAGLPTPTPEPGYAEARGEGSPLARAYKVIMFDWDGTAVASRADDASILAGILTELLALGVWVVVVTGTNFANIDRQLCHLIPPRHRRRLVVCTNRGSEVYRFDRHGTPARRYLRVATPAEEEALTRVAEAVRAALARCTGLDVEVVHNRLNRRKIDLIPVPQWADPPKEAIGALLAAVEERLRGAGLEGGLARAVILAREVARQHGLADARITSDAKHIEIGLTDKGDSAAWVRDHLLRRLRIDPACVLLAGDEFGPIGGLPGSDDRMRAAIPDAVTISVGVEPTGVPAGVLYLGGGPTRFRALLLEQVRRHRLARLRRRARAADRIIQALEPTHDPDWRLEQHGYVPALEHEYESRTTVSNGFLGVRGALEQPTAASHPGTYIAGLFDTVPTPYRMPVLVHAPDWLRLSIDVNGGPTSLEAGSAAAFTRTLDLRRGVLLTRQAMSGPNGSAVELRTLRLASHAIRAVALHLTQVEVTQPTWVTLAAVLAPPHDGLTLVTAADSVAVWRTIHEERYLAVGWEALVAELGGARAPRAWRRPQERHWSWVAVPEERAVITRLATFAHGDSAAEAVQAAQAALRRARRSGLKNLYRAHARVWAQRWQEADIVLEGETAVQRALRFALYHLISAANPENERVSIGARALTGEAYRGHVFWDTEIFLLPFYIYTWPAAARALLMYRYHTLPAARAKAARLGYRGALYAWESADTGEEATPPWVVAPDGTVIPIRNGEQEHHVSADVAYAVWHYWQATRDVPFLLRAGAEIILETARFWSSRANLEADGRYHIRGVIGPDEYHENVDDNAYTNVMAQWNIERGLEVADLLARRWPERWAQLQDRLALTPDELAHWRDVAEGLVTGACTDEGVIEQFRGYFELEPIDLSALAARTAPLDVVLGRERTQRSQVIKQADVVMLLALLWDRFPAPVREANFRFYEPRCGHGSSLSPPVHALVAARLGDTERAARYLAQTAAIDLEDSMGNVAGGVHVGALGGLWQAVVFGVLGFDPWSPVPRLEPHLPRAWQALRVPLRWRGRSLLVEVGQEPLRLTITLRRGRPLTVQVGALRQRLTRGRPWTCRWDAGNRSWQEEAP
jgi:trehalose/maltose hydrolase-like predicted phosphorylase